MDVLTLFLCNHVLTALLYLFNVFSTVYRITSQVHLDILHAHLDLFVDGAFTFFKMESFCTFLLYQTKFLQEAKKGFLCVSVVLFEACMGIQNR